MGLRSARTMNTDILPLAITMMAGPQIMSAIIFVTSERALKNSLAFVLGVLVATTLGVLALAGIHRCRGQRGLRGPLRQRSTGHIIQYALIALLVAFALKNYLRPRDGRAAQVARQAPAGGHGAGAAHRPAGDPLHAVGPDRDADRRDQPRAARRLVTAAVPFILLTTLIAALPLLGFLLFHRRAVHAMPALRDWMNSNSWLVNIIVCGIFIVLIV